MSVDLPKRLETTHKKFQIAILDLGSGNLHSVRAAMQRAAGNLADVHRVKDLASLGDSSQWDAMVVPGQGAFGDCMRGVRARGFEPSIRRHIDSGKAFLGICVGMQILFERSEESLDEPGLGILAGDVRKLSNTWKEGGRRIRIPHMGWNAVYAGAQPLGWFYFAHSYYCCPQNLSDVSATVEYGAVLCAAVQRGNIWACQFHPEKSDADGLWILKRWLADLSLLTKASPQTRP